MSWAELRQQVNLSLNIEDLRTLCFDLGIEYDNLLGEGKEGKVRELIAMMRRGGEIPKLIEHLGKIRPSISWVDIQLDNEAYNSTNNAIENLPSSEDLDEKDEEGEGILDWAVTIIEAGDKLVT